MKKLTKNAPLSYIKLGMMLAVIIVMAVIVPVTSRVYTLTVISGALIYFVACLGNYVILGMCGMVSFASVTFMGIGGYASALLSSRLGINSIVAMLLSTILTMIVALLIGMILMRLKGTFFTFSTVALVQISYSIFNSWKEVTGGPNGLANLPPFEIFGISLSSYKQSYILLLVFCVICVLLALKLRKTTLGRAMNSVRDNEIAAKTMGINVYWTKVIAFAIAAMFAGLAGALMVHYNHFVVSTYFTFDISTKMIIMTMLGGVDNPIGVFLGAILITMLPEWLKPLQEYIRLVYGVGVMLLMVFMPQGIWGVIESTEKKLSRKFKWGKKTVIGVDDKNAQGGPNVTVSA